MRLPIPDERTNERVNRDVQMKKHQHDHEKQW